MTDGSDPRLVRHLSVFAAAVSLFSMVVGFVTLLGWGFHITFLKTVGLGQVTMRANAALCFVLIGTSLWLQRKKDTQPFAGIKKRIAQVAAGIAGLVGLLSLAEYLFDWDLGIDQLLFVERYEEAVVRAHPGLMSPIAALDFLLLGLALLVLDQRTQRGHWPAQFVALPAAIAALFGIFNFVLDPSIPHTHIALLSALTLFVYPFGLVCARTEWGLGALLARQSLGGALTRYLFPASFLVPMLVGWLQWRAFQADLYSEWAWVTVVTVIAITLLAGLTAWTGFVIDRTEAKRREAGKALHASEERFRLLLDGVKDYAIYMLDPEGRVASWNTGAAAINGYQTEEVLGQHFSCFYTAEDRASGKPERELQEATRQGRFEEQARRVRKDGAAFWAHVMVTPMYDEAGTLRGFSKIVRDITERKQAEELAWERARQQEAVAALGQFALAGDELQPLMERAVAMVAETLGVEYCKVLELLPRGDALRLRAGVGWKPGLVGAATVGAGKDSQAGYTLACDGPVVVEDLGAETRFTGPPLLHEHGVVSGLSVVIAGQMGRPFGVLGAHTKTRRSFSSQDAHFLQEVANILGLAIARKRAEEQLANQAEELSTQAGELARSAREIRQLNDELEQRVAQRTAQLEAANKELEAFTYSVSHDLRAPLRHIGAYSKILLEEFGPTLDSGAQHYLQRIQEGTRRMGQLVDDLLNLARVGRHELHLQVAGLNPVVEEVLSDLKPECEGRQVEWKLSDLPFVECDPALLRQVFQNLLANALKFTRPRSRAVIEVGQTAANGQPVIFVRDNGVGFSMKYADKLFGVFQRLHRLEDFEGTGVGLATVQRIVQKHGGKIWAEAELDKGATFAFTLGVAEPAGLKSKAAAAGAKS